MSTTFTALLFSWSWQEFTSPSSKKTQELHGIVCVTVDQIQFLQAFSPSFRNMQTQHLYLQKGAFRQLSNVYSFHIHYSAFPGFESGSFFS